jgi:hypothetical protein
MKKQILLLLTTVLLSTANIFAQGGTTGPLTWNISSGTLTISVTSGGTGAMPNYGWGVAAPWYAYRDSIYTTVIETGVTSIGDMAFYHCYSLTSILIPSSVTNIGSMAISFCSKLTSITNQNPVPIDITSSVFPGTNQSTCTLKVPIGSIPAYKNAEVWKEFNIGGIGGESFLVTVKVNNDGYGIAIGGGLYEKNETIFVTATAFYGYKFVNWTKNGVEVSTENIYSFTVTEDVELVANFIDNVGIETLETTTVEIYPNPTTGELKIVSGLRATNVFIYDVSGKIQKTENWKTENTIDISYLPAGVYFVKIFTEAGEVTRKVLKE